MKKQLNTTDGVLNIMKLLERDVKFFTQIWEKPYDAYAVELYEELDPELINKYSDYNVVEKCRTVYILEKKK